MKKEPVLLALKMRSTTTNAKNDDGCAAAAQDNIDS